MKELIKILMNEIKELTEKINQLQTFKDCAICYNDECENKAQHSDGSRLWCSDCWEGIEEWEGFEDMEPSDPEYYI